MHDNKFFALLNFPVALVHHGFKIAKGVNLGLHLFSGKVQFILQDLDCFCQTNMIGVNNTRGLIE